MRPSSPFEQVFGRIYGKPCWGAKIGYGSFLTLEFGNPHLEVRPPISTRITFPAKVRQNLAHRRVYVHGQWHLWIYCCDWEVLANGKHIGDSSTKRSAQRAAAFLDGLKLIKCVISPKTGRTLFKFEAGTSLRTRPFDADSEQWLLYEPSKKVLVVRAGGEYQYGRSDVSENAREWK